MQWEKVGKLKELSKILFCVLEDWEQASRQEVDARDQPADAFEFAEMVDRCELLILDIVSDINHTVLD